MPTNQPPTTAQELERDEARLATEGYVRPLGAAGGSRWPTDTVPLPVRATPDEGARPVEHIRPALDPTGPANLGQPLACGCGCTWLFPCYMMVVGRNRAERLPGSPPLYKCASCGAVHQEVTPSQFERLTFGADGRLSR